MNIQLDETKSVLYVKPTGPLKAEDFLKLSDMIDPYINQHGGLKALVIETITFPGCKI